MYILCPYCEEQHQVKWIDHTDRFTVRGEEYAIDTQLLECQNCHQAFEDSTKEHDPLEIAYRKYREKHRLLMPEDISTWRKQVGLTQRELSEILGLGKVTITRYENGALQNESQDKMIRMAMKPETLLSLIKDSGEILSEMKKSHIISQLRKECADPSRVDEVFQACYASYEPSELSGYQPLDIDKVYNLILKVCGLAKPLKTKLNKLLFYCDFLHYKEHTRSITGLRYQHYQYGPVPEHYEPYFARLVDNKQLNIEEVEIHNYIGEEYSPSESANDSVFSEAELATISKVCEFFIDFNSTQIKDFSHEEKAYTETEDEQIISYNFAKDLKI